jgi:hypothetical protein
MKIKQNTFGRLRQEECEFKASLGYIARSCLKQTNNVNKNKANNTEKALSRLSEM